MGELTTKLLKAIKDTQTETEKYQKFCLFVFIIASLANLMLTAGRFCFSAILKPLAADLAISRAVASGILSLVMITYAFFSPVAGYLSDRYGFRRVVLAGSLVAFSGMLLSSSAQDVWQLYFFYGVLFGAGSATFYSVPLAEVRKWFVFRSGLILALVSCAGAVGIWIGPPLADWLVRLAGWRTAFLVIGILGMALLAPTAYFLKVPGIVASQKGSGDNKEDLEKKSCDQAYNASLSLQEAFRTLQFWLLSLSYGSFGIGQFIILVHTLAYATDQGISSTHAAFTVGMLGAIGIPSRLLVGLWADYQGRRIPLIILGFVQVAALLFLLPLQSLWQLWAFVFVFGFCYGGMLSQFAGLLGDIFGPRELASIYGLQTFFIGLTGALGSWLGGFIFDLTGTYYWAYVIAMISLLVSAIGIAGGSRRLVK